MALGSSLESRCPGLCDFFPNSPLFRSRIILRSGQDSRSSSAWGPASLLLGSLLLLLLLNLLHVTLNLGRGQCLDRGARCHQGNLDVLGSGLDNLEQGLDSQSDGSLPVHILLVVSLEELAHSLAGTADSIRLPKSTVSMRPRTAA